MIYSKTKTDQKGLSLLELLIAMVIGLFLLAGITSSFIHSKKSSIQRDEFSILQDNGRIALDLMSKTIAHTGYLAFPSGVIAPNSFITSTVTSNTCSGGGTNVMTTGNFSDGLRKDGLSGASDSIGVIYLGDDNLFTDCAGGPLPDNCRVGNGNSEAAQIYNSFFVEDNTLKCAGSGTATEVVISEDIENVQFLYGIDADDDKVVDRYINATDIGTSTLNVISVQIGVLVRSEKQVKNKSEIVKYSVLDQAVVSEDDRFLRAVFTTTVNLRNAL